MVSFSYPVVSAHPGFMTSPLHVFPSSLMQLMARWRQESLPMVLTNQVRSGQEPGMHLVIQPDDVSFSLHRRTGKSVYRYVDVAGILSLDGVPADYHDALTLRAMIMRLLEQVQVGRARVLAIATEEPDEADSSYVRLAGDSFRYVPVDATAVMASEWLAVLKQDGQGDEGRWITTKGLTKRLTTVS
ncbi:hypothetical protein EBZ35_02710 [bacterium]|nr:hypothetical protein [bacterium]